MLNTLLELPFALNRHRDAPLFGGEISFSEVFAGARNSRAALRNVSGQMLHVIDLLKLEALRDVDLAEVKEAARRWGEEQRANARARTYVRTESYFESVAKKWLHFAGKLKSPLTPRIWFTDYLEDFARWMTEEQGLSSLSVRSHRWRASRFLTWFAERHAGLAHVRLQDVDEFLILQGSTRWSRTSVTVAAQALRSFSVMRSGAAGANPASRKGSRAPADTSMKDCRKGRLGRKCSGCSKASRATARPLSVRERSCCCSRSMGCAVERCHVFC